MPHEFTAGSLPAIIVQESGATDSTGGVAMARRSAVGVVCWLMLAATGGVLPDLTWLYFALSQFPIYLSPQLLQPIARHLTTQTRITPPQNRGPNT